MAVSSGRPLPTVNRMRIERTREECWDRAWAIAAEAHLDACMRGTNYSAHAGTSNTPPGEGNATMPARTSAR